MKEQENLTGKGITAAVLDTGIFPHMDFDGRIAAFRDLVYGRETPDDDNGHGTHACGILGGSGRARTERSVPCSTEPFSVPRLS